MALLKTKNLIKIYRSGYEGIRALGGINLEFNRNEFVAILGPSGCGKSTFLNVISGLDVPSSGEVIIQGQSTRFFNKNSWDIYRRYNLGFIFQHFNLINNMTALENVALVLTLCGVSLKERNERAKAMLDRVGLAGKYNNTPLELSGGEKQRVAIARALINNPDIILADEPTGSLDSKTAVEIMNLLKEVAKDKLLIMVTHNHEFATTYANRIIKMEDGLIIEDQSNIEIIPSTNTRLKFSNRGLKYVDGIKLITKSLKNHLGRLIATIVACAIGISGVALIVGLGEGANRFADEQINKYLNANIIPVVYAQKTVGGAINPKTPTNEILNQLVEEVGPNRLSYRYNYDDILAKSNAFELFYIDETSYDRNVYLSYQDVSFISDQQYLKHYQTYFVEGSRFSDMDNINEVMVNSSLLERIIVQNNLDVKYDYFLNKSIKMKFKIVQRDKYGNDLYEFTFNEDMKIVGILKELDLFSSPSIYIYHSTFKNKINKLSPGFIASITNDTCTDSICLTTKELEVLDTTHILDVTKKINESKLLDSNRNSFLHIMDVSLLFKNIISQAISIAQFILALFIITAIIVSMFMISILLYTSVMEKRLEIGVLKALGSTNKDVKRYVLSEAFVVGIMSALSGLVLALIIQFIVYFISPSFLGTDYRFLIINIPIIRGITYSNQLLLRYIPFIVPLLLLVLSTLVAFISGLIPAQKATKIAIIDVLREE
jgi:putative ABC transport system permease protein